MDAMQQLLTLVLAVLVFVAIFRRSTRHARPSPIPAVNIEVTHPAIARRMLIDHADAFSNHPTSPFPVDFSAGRTGVYSITTVPYGPLWSALRRNLTARIVHPSRLGLIAPLQRDAVEAVVAGLHGRHGAGGEVVVVRDCLRSAVFALAARLCFGDGVKAATVRAMEHAQLEFMVAYVEAKAMAASTLARLLHWRRWLHFANTFSRVFKYLMPLIAERRRRHHCRCDGAGIVSYIDSLFELHVPEEHDERTDTRRRSLTDEQIAPLVWEFLGAGVEPVVSCVEFALAHLITRPEVQSKLHSEIVSAGGVAAVSEERLHGLPYLRAVVLECLRLHPPVPLIVRDVDGANGAAAGAAAATTTPAAAGTTKLMRFTLVARDIGRSGDVWTDPDEFRPERFLDGGEGASVGPVPGPKEIKMMPFGAGRRYCPGTGLGMVHAALFLAALVREFEWAPPAAEGASSAVDMSELNGFFKLMKTPLRARITPRTTS